MSLNTSKREQVAQRRALVAKYRVEQKLTQSAIAAKLGVSVATVNADVQALDKQWQKEAGIDIATLRARQLAEIAGIKKYAWMHGPEPPTLRLLLHAIKLEAQITGTITPPSLTLNVAVLLPIVRALEASGVPPEKAGEAFETWFKQFAAQQHQELTDG